MPLSPTKRGKYWYIRGTVAKTEIFETTRIPHKGAAKPTKIVKDFCKKREEELEEEYVYGKSRVATFIDAAQSYIDSGGSPRFLGKYDPDNDTWSGLIGKIGSARLRDIDQEFLNKKAKELYPTAKPETVNRQFWTPFIAVWRHASKGNNPLCQPVEWQRPKIKKSKSRAKKPVPYEDAIKFINALSYPAAKVMFFLFWTGCRPIEAFTLTQDAVSVENQWIALEDTKTDVPRGIPAHKCLLPLLNEICTEHVFLNMHGRPYPSRAIYNEHGRIIEHGGGQLDTPILTAQEKTGIHITPGVPRHTVSTYLIWPAGVSPMVKDEILGHADENEMRQHYTHLPRQSLIDAINKLPWPDGLRADLLEPDKIRAAHERGKAKNL